jgi:DNA-binding CsgD family transcriptional regulator
LQLFRKTIQEKNELITQFQSEIHQASSIAETNAGSDVLPRILEMTILTDADWTYFQGLFEKLHKGYLSRLRERFPYLTPGEVRLIAFTRLRLSNKEICAMQGVSLSTVRSTKSRLCRKMNLPDVGNFEEFIEAI